MNQTLQATYHDDNLILEKRLDSRSEGQQLTIILVDSEPTESDFAEQRRQFLDWAKQYSNQLPADYKFNREEAHE
ncbi:hypothetical protein [Microcystis aeruginosa]|uniref:DUF104 domain-containing protein n=1 Tax=Microcystis aeruginosa 11-30S32 TaxID=2358142 RepID=A0A510PER9_MICAE|nr:hypothetical protein [Microcystis aeruginosa]GCA92287.1 hypothetical protein MAE30S32_09390 [Microcystis aeruginosa 11-30S32]